MSLDWFPGASLYSTAFVSGYLSAYQPTANATISGGRFVSIASGGGWQIASASLSGTMPAQGFVADNVLTNAPFTYGTPQAVYSYGLIGITSAANSGLLSIDGATLYVGRSGRPTTLASGGFLSGDVLQPIGTCVSSGLMLLDLGQPLFSGSGGSASLTSGIVTSGYIGNNAVTSGNIASGQVGINALSSGLVSGLVLSGQLGSGQIAAVHISSGTLLGISGIIITPGLSGITISTSGLGGSSSGSSTPPIGYIYGLRMTGCFASGTQSFIVQSGYAADMSGSTTIKLATNQTVYLSGNLNGKNNLDACNIGSAAQSFAGAPSNFYGYFMASGFTWPVRSGTGLMTISGTACHGASGTDFLSQVAVGDLIGVWGSGMYNVGSVNSGIITLVVSGSILSGSPVNIVESPTIAQSGLLAYNIAGMYGTSSGDYLSCTSGTGLTVSGNCSGKIWIGQAPQWQSPMYVFVGTGLSGTAAFVSTQRTTPLVSGMVGYV